jgi:hypothetical protein
LEKRFLGCSKFLYFTGVPERIRTSDPKIRNLVLYPAELRAPFSFIKGATERGKLMKRPIFFLEVCLKNKWRSPRDPSLY